MRRTKRSGKKHLRVLALVAMSVAVGLLTPAGAAGQGGEGLPLDELFPPDLQWIENCPQEAAFPPEASTAGNFRWCINVKAYDGELKLGDTEATIDDPLEVTVGVGLLPGNEPAIVMSDSEGGGSVSEVNVPGGLLGIPELDALPDPLGVLSVTATPQLGEISADVQGLSTHLERIRLPLSIKLNNLLFGEDCSIGTPEDPFVIDLTTGTTEPPAGVAPISGDPGVELPHRQWYLNRDDSSFQDQRVGARSVDNTFAVPGATRCDLLPQDAHDGVQDLSDQLEQALDSDLPLDELAGSDAGVFDPVINQQVGLPAGPGRNHMKISVDTQLTNYWTVRASRREIPVDWIAWPVEFGEVELGTTSEVKTLTIRNPGPDPLSLEEDMGLPILGASGFEVVNDGCAGRTLDQGESCEVDFQYTPTTSGDEAVRYGEHPTSFFMFEPMVTISGVGVPGLAAPQHEFGKVQVGHSSETKAVTFENAGSQTHAIDGASLTGGNSTDWEIAEDRCSGETIEPGETCSVDLRFSPRAAGPKQATLELHAGSLLAGEVSLTGEGVAPLAPNASSLEFGTVDVGGTADAQTATFEHAGSEPAVVESATVAGVANRIPSWNILSDDCSGGTLGTGDTCQLEITLSPDSAGIKDARVELRGAGSVVLGTVEVTGSGVNPLTPEPEALDFGNLIVGDDAIQTATFTHTGSQTANVAEGAVVDGVASRLASWEIVSDSCAGQALEAGGQCQVGVRFAPTSSGVKDVDLEIRGAGSVALGVVDLDGRGVNP